MKEFIIYSILISLLYLYSGTGLTLLLSPKKFEKYTLYLSPFVGLSYLSYVGWFFTKYGIGGTDVYARLLLFPPIIFLIAAMIIKKERIGELFWPFRKENLLLIAICVLIFGGISAPYLLRVNGLNAISLGNNDIASYAAVSKFMTISSLSQSELGMYGIIPFLAENDRFAAFISTAIPSSIFQIEPYKIQNILIYIFFVFELPVIFLVGLEIFKYNKTMSMMITLLSGISFHLLYINYHGFLGQVIGTGLFLSLFLFTFYPVFNCEKFSCFKPYIPLTIVFTFGLVATYSTLMLLFLFPLLFYFIFVFLSKKSFSNFSNALIFILFIIFATLLISPVLFINLIKRELRFTNVASGWDIPVLSPDWLFGLVGTNIGMQPVPIIYRFVLSIPIILIIIISFVHLKKERHIYNLSRSYIYFILLLYIYLTLREVSSSSFTGDSYKAYKLISYFIPIILLIGLSYFRNFQLLAITKITKNQILGMILLLLLIAGNILSASAMIYNNYYNSFQIKESVIDLQNIAKMDNVSSINILETSYWDQMWIYYFLFMDKKLYLQKSTYYHSSPLLGEWTLMRNETRNDIVDVSKLKQDIIEINNDYYLVKYFSIAVTLDKGWYELESNQYAKWRWTGANNESTTVLLDVLKENLSVDFFLNYWSLDGNNNFTVFLDDKKIKDCKDKKSCILNDILISKGKHEINFNTILPPRLPEYGDQRRLGYAFSNISITIHN